MPQTPLGSLQRSPIPSTRNKGGLLLIEEKGWNEGKGGEEGGGRGRKREGNEGEGRKAREGRGRGERSARGPCVYL